MSVPFLRAGVFQKVLPVNMVKTRSPNAQTSAALVISPRSVCSGASHIGVPVAAVALRFSTIFAIPKSSTFTCNVSPVLRRTPKKTF